MTNFLLLIVQIVSLFLKTARKHDDCPDGICEEPLATATTLTVQLQNPKVSLGFFDLFRLLRCVPMDRVVAVGKRIFALFRECDRCPDGDCNFFDILRCIDLAEAVDIAKEVLAIIRDSQICDDDSSDDEITLGEAVA